MLDRVMQAGNSAYELFGLNTSIFLLINQFHAPVFDEVMLAVSGLSHPVLYAFYIAVALTLTLRKPDLLPLRNVVVFAISYVLTSLVVVPALKTTLDFPRPVSVLGKHAVTILGNPDVLQSFPSGHSAFAVIVAASLSPGMPRLGRMGLWSFAVLVCLSRISVGAHFPADVIAGAGIAIFVVFGVRALCSR